MIKGLKFKEDYTVYEDDTLKEFENDNDERNDINGFQCYQLWKYGKIDLIDFDIEDLKDIQYFLQLKEIGVTNPAATKQVAKELEEVNTQLQDLENEINKVKSGVNERLKEAEEPVKRNKYQELEHKRPLTSEEIDYLYTRYHMKDRPELEDDFDSLFEEYKNKIEKELNVEFNKKQPSNKYEKYWGRTKIQLPNTNDYIKILLSYHIPSGYGPNFITCYYSAELAKVSGKGSEYGLAYDWRETYEKLGGGGASAYTRISTNKNASEEYSGKIIYEGDSIDKFIEKIKQVINKYNKNNSLDEDYEDDDYADFEYEINIPTKPRDKWEDLNWLEFDENYNYGEGKRYHAEGKDWYFNIYELEDGTWNLIVDYDTDEHTELDNIYSTLEEAQNRALEIYNGEWTGFDESLTEGCWSCPNTVKKARELVKLLSQPLPAGEAKDKLYNLIGDDALFDDIDDREYEEGPDYDVSYLVKSWILGNIIKEDAVEWRVPFDDEVINIFKRMLKKDPLFRGELNESLSDGNIKRIKYMVDKEIQYYQFDDKDYLKKTSTDDAWFDYIENNDTVAEFDDEELEVAKNYFISRIEELKNDIKLKNNKPKEDKEAKRNFLKNTFWPYK